MAIQAVCDRKRGVDDNGKVVLCQKPLDTQQETNVVIGNQAGSGHLCAECAAELVELANQFVDLTALSRKRAVGRALVASSGATRPRRGLARTDAKTLTGATAEEVRAALLGWKQDDPELPITTKEAGRIPPADLRYYKERIDQEATR
ncbi:hypothetical protein [Nonomuraea typhae]|uniref:hypothetical protein n=1 Tax=Nonomuraea typhae TaxID=2603600 RepID=UPI0012FA925F|nr:hypothetical protein [Nonomuraea typhae]